jgi:hypothetical protein
MFVFRTLVEDDVVIYLKPSLSQERSKSTGMYDSLFTFLITYEVWRLELQ